MVYWKKKRKKKKNDMSRNRIKKCVTKGEWMTVIGNSKGLEKLILQHFFYHNYDVTNCDLWVGKKKILGQCKFSL